MKQDKWYILAGRYLRQYLSTALMFGGFAAIFGIVFRLYDLETEAVLYAAGLSALLAAAVLSVHFFFYLKRHRERMRLLQNIDLLAEELPVPKTLAEDDLQKMIWELKRILDFNITRRQTEYRESVDYYTTWCIKSNRPYLR